MARRFALEWLWFIGSGLLLMWGWVIFKDLAPATSDNWERLTLIVIFTPVAYAVIGLVRLTIWALTEVAGVPPGARIDDP